jgi:mono/diheme cytochrome c family protein
MKRDFKSCMLYALFGLPIFLLLFIASIYFANCGFSTDCSQASLPGIIHTPIPTLIPAGIPSQVGVKLVQVPTNCLVTTRDLLSGWVGAGYQETQPFNFRDVNGNTCQATFTDVLPLFTQADLWYKGALACDSCHNSDISIAAANLDMSSYAGIVAGTKRTPPAGQGEDILGGGKWEQSLLNQVLFVNQLMPFGHPLGDVAPNGPTIQAGTLVTNPVVTPTEAPTAGEITPTETTPSVEVARPSNPGGAGNAIDLTGNLTAGEKVYGNYCQVCHGLQGGDGISNPGSNDGTMPALKPIDSSLVDTDYRTYAYNLDLFIENGSVPAGLNPAFLMPDWGAKRALTQQQIADVIAYIISLNP